MGDHRLYLVGGAPRVGKSSLAQRLLELDGIPWPPDGYVQNLQQAARGGGATRVGCIWLSN
jgi:chloramphenicol 3-O-phosphotransferase